MGLAAAQSGDVSAPGVGPGASHRGPPSVAAGAVGILLLALAIAGVPLAALGHQLNWSNVEWLAVMVPFGAVGFLVAWRQPRNPLGWFLVAAAVLLLVQSDADFYVTFDYLYRHGHLVGGPAAVFLSTISPVQVPLAFVIVLFPAGHLPSPRWKWFLVAVSVVAALALVGSVGEVAQLFVDHRRVVVNAVTDNIELGRAGRDWSWATHANGLGFVVFGVLIVCWIVHHVRRYRHSSGDFRQQMKWLIVGTVFTAAAGAVLITWSTTVGSGSPWWLYAVLAAAELALAALPVCLGVAILRFRLYDIDRVVSRTLSYAILTGLVIGVYVGVVTLATKAIGFSSPVGVAASTLVAAALFNPLRRRLQRWIDRRFNRARYDAQQTVSAFAGRLRQSVDPGSISLDLTAVVQAVFEPSAVGVWIRGESA